MRYIFNICLILFFSAFSYTQTQTYQVGYLLDQYSSEIQTLLDELSNEISVVVGEDATIVFSKENQLNNNFSADQALKNYQTLLNNNTDIIIAFGVVNNDVISKLSSYEKPTIVFGALSQELREYKPLATNIKNYTSLITSQSYTEDLKILQQLADPKIVGVAVERAFTENINVENAFNSIGEALGMQMKIIPFSNLNDITSNLEGIDALYMAGGFYLENEEIKSLAQALIDKRLPSFTSNPVIDVQYGLLASNHNQSELNQFFRRIALTVESVVNGEELGSLSTVLESKKQLTVKEIR